jgi:hypothetical protein
MTLHVLRERTARGRAVLVSRGLPRGTIDELRAQIDDAMAIAASEEVEVLVLARYASFRVPDAVLRYAIAHARRYRARLSNLYFVDLGAARRTVFRAACRALPEEIRELVRVVDHLDDPVLARAAADDSVDAIAVPTRTLPPLGPPRLVLDVLKHASRRDRWTPKRLHLSDAHAWYVDASDARLVSERVPCAECVLRPLGDGVARLASADRAWTLKFHTRDALRTLAEHVRVADDDEDEAGECAA